MGDAGGAHDRVESPLATHFHRSDRAGDLGGRVRKSEVIDDLCIGVGREPLSVGRSTSSGRPMLGSVKGDVDVDVQSGVGRDQHQPTLSAEGNRSGRHAPQVVLARHQAKVVASA